MPVPLLTLLFLAVPDVPPEPPPNQSAQEVSPGVFLVGVIDEGDYLIHFYRIGHGHERQGFYVNILDRMRTQDAGSWVVANGETHALVVRERRDRMPVLQDALRLLESPQPQVMLEATIAEVTFDRDFQLGFEGAMTDLVLYTNAAPRQFLQSITANLSPQGPLAGDPFQGTSFRFRHIIEGVFTLDGLLRTFVQTGRANIRANPRLLVNNGAQATIQTVQQVPIPSSVTTQGATQTVFQYRDIGIVTTITPHVIGENQIELVINVELSATSSTVTLGTGVNQVTVPVIETRRTNTTLTVRSGDEIAISGMNREEQLSVRRGLPILSDIPIIGPLFGRTEDSSLRSDIIFVIRPRIFHPTTEDVPQVIRPDD